MSNFGGLTVRGTSAKRAVIKLPTFGYQVITHTGGCKSNIAKT